MAHESVESVIGIVWVSQRNRSQRRVAGGGSAAGRRSADKDSHPNTGSRTVPFTPPMKRLKRKKFETTMKSMKNIALRPQFAVSGRAAR